MKNRFDLEESIFNCWTLVDDLKLFANLTSLEQAQKLAKNLSEVYQVKFENLFSTFEDSI